MHFPFCSNGKTGHFLIPGKNVHLTTSCRYQPILFVDSYRWQATLFHERKPDLHVCQLMYMEACVYHFSFVSANTIDGDKVKFFRDSTVGGKRVLNFLAIPPNAWKPFAHVGFYDIILLSNPLCWLHQLILLVHLHFSPSATLGIHQNLQHMLQK